MLLKDQLKRTLQLKGIPKRIVSLVPSQTELLVDLGLVDALVGVTKFCVHPKHLQKEKTIIGGTKQVNFDKIKALKPDIILCNKEENTKEMIFELEQIAPVHISDIFNLEDVLELIDMYGKLFLVESKAEILNKKITRAHHDFCRFIKGQPKLKVAYFIWKNPWMVAANQTFINEMLAINNFENVFQDVDRYPEITLSELKERKPDVILLSSEPYPFKDKDIDEFKAVFPEAKVKIVDGESFSWYGSRLLKAYVYFQALQNTIRI